MDLSLNGASLEFLRRKSGAGNRRDSRNRNTRRNFRSNVELFQPFSGKICRAPRVTHHTRRTPENHLPHGYGKRPNMALAGKNASSYSSQWRSCVLVAESNAWDLETLRQHV